MAFAITKYNAIEGRDSKGRLIRSWFHPKLVEYAKYQLEFTMKAQVKMEEYFSIDYPLPKLDILGLGDFAHKAMENWGLITYDPSSRVFI